MRKPSPEAKKIEEAIRREGLLNPLPDDQFKRLARRIFKAMKIDPAKHDKLLEEAMEGRAQTQADFKKTLD